MARDEHPESTRRSFFVRTLTGVAGGWVALTGTGVVSTLIAACTRKGESGKERSQPVDKYGGPPRRDPDPVVTKYGGPPPVVKYGGPPTLPPDVVAPADAGTGLGSPGGPPKYGGPRHARKYGGPVRKHKTKYGGPRRPPLNATKYGGPRHARKYGGPVRKHKTKYGGPRVGKKYGAPAPIL